MHNRQGISLRQIIEALCDWRLWPIYILGITHQGKFRSVSGTLVMLAYELSSAYRSSSGLSDTLLEEPWLYHDTDESTDYTFDHYRSNNHALRGIFQ